MHSFRKLEHSAFQNSAYLFCGANGSKVIRSQRHPTSKSDQLRYMQLVLRAHYDFDKCYLSFFYWWPIVMTEKNLPKFLQPGWGYYSFSSHASGKIFVKPRKFLHCFQTFIESTNIKWFDQFLFVTKPTNIKVSKHIKISSVTSSSE